MASPTQWTRAGANSERPRRTGKPGVLQSMGLQSDTTQRPNNKQQSNMLSFQHIINTEISGAEFHTRFSMLEREAYTTLRHTHLCLNQPHASARSPCGQRLPSCTDVDPCFVRGYKMVKILLCHSPFIYQQECFCEEKLSFMDNSDSP